ncbi:MAG: SPOR domain-containing protein [Bacillota bacterium]|nr:SPOR domain-containing protein [Bacillota bacterium]
MRRQIGERRNPWPALTLLLILAVGIGYLAAKYVFEPYLLEGEDAEDQTIAAAEGSAVVGGSGEGTEAEGQSPEEQAAETEGSLPETPAPEEGEAASAVQEETASETVSGQGEGEAGAEPAETETESAGALMYCVQFGSFSTREGAESALAGLKEKSVDAYLVERDGAYKLLGAPCGSKEEAVRLRDSLIPQAGEDLFVTTMEVTIQ